MEASDAAKTLEQAEAHKAKGNDFFKESKYEEALEEYTKAIEANVTDGKKFAIYYANRAFTQLKLENYGFAIEDATNAIAKDATFPKGYYRRASAYFALGKYKQAAANFKRVFELSNDKDAEDKYKLASKLNKAQLLADAIKVENEVDKINPQTINEIEVAASYTGPRLEENDEVTREWVIKLIEWMKDQKTLHKKYLWTLLIKVRNILKALPTLVDVEVPNGKEITVCGDTHGQYYDVLNIFSINGYPSADNPYLFNGDFVDRGSFSVEVITCFLAWKVADPNCMHLTRGNHEAKSMNNLYGFEGEVLHKYDVKTYDLFCDIFCHMPLVYVLNKKVMITHGGLFSKDGVKLDDIRKLDRLREPPEDGIMCELLWSDPHPQNGRHPSKRGVGTQFGPDVAHRFLDDNGLDYLVRSHEMKQGGYEEEANGRVITIFSAPNYCDQMGNKGAFIRFKGGEMKPKFTQFNAVEHPKIPVMAYARGNNSWM
jgi:serine/threonine-protein phosphatase 5